MKRILAIAGILVAAAALTLIVFSAGASDDGANYRVRAIFMSAFSVIPNGASASCGPPFTKPGGKRATRRIERSASTLPLCLTS